MSGLTKSPAGAQQWKPKEGILEQEPYPMHMILQKRHAPFMLTTDLALKADPAYEKISRHFHENPAEFADAFAVHGLKTYPSRYGPRARYLGTEVPAEELIWQDPIPAIMHELVDEKDITALKEHILATGLSVAPARNNCVGCCINISRFR